MNPSQPQADPSLPDEELQYRLIHSIVVAGKSYKFAYQKCRLLFPDTTSTPFEQLQSYRDMGTLHGVLRDVGTGNYHKLETAFCQILDRGLDPRTCTLDELEAVHGISFKTSRFFLLWTRPSYRCAALDRHILRWLGLKGYDVTANTPSSQKRYRALEQAFLDEADARGLTPRELDHAIWTEYTGHSEANERTRLIAQS